MTGQKWFILCAAGFTPEGLSLNVGDEALSDCLESALIESGSEVTRSATGLQHSRQPVRASLVPTRPLRRTIAAIRAADHVGVGGGTMLQPHAKLCRAVLFTLIVARAMRKQTSLAAVGVESSSGRAYSVFLSVISKLISSKTTVRDEGSRATLVAAGFSDVHVVSDPILLLGRSKPDRLFGVVAVSLRADAPDSLIRSIAEAIERKSIKEVILVPMDNLPSADREPLRRLESLLDGTPATRWIEPSLPWQEYVAEFSRAEYFVGMRLHFLYFGALADARITVIESSDKTASFAEQFGLSSSRFDATDMHAAFDISEQTVDAERFRAAVLRAQSLVPTLTGSTSAR